MNSDVEYLHKALHSYHNVQCNTMEEFNEDLNKVHMVRKMLNRYKTCGEITHRLTLNHIVTLFNVFGNTALDLILYKIPREQYPSLFPFLLFLDRLPEETLTKYTVELDEIIVNELKNI